MTGREQKTDNDVFFVCSLIELCKNKEKELIDVLIEVYSSWISDKIDNYNSSMYYENPSYFYYSYLE